jgi:hypothetical protein
MWSVRAAIIVSITLDWAVVNVLPHLGIQQALTGNEGIHGTQEHADIFPAQLCGQALQEHPLDMELLFVRKERNIPYHHRHRDNYLQAMWFPIVGS